MRVMGYALVGVGCLAAVGGSRLLWILGGDIVWAWRHRMTAHLPRRALALGIGCIGGGAALAATAYVFLVR